jgi:hypothetical protein
MRRTICFALLFCHLTALAQPALAARIKLGHLIQRANPANAVRTARDNWKAGRFYATDLTEHSTVRGAVKRSIFPTDPKANIRAALKARFHWTRLIGAAVAPLTIEAQRQLTSGNGFNWQRIKEAVDLRVMATTFAGGVAGEAGGAWVQSSLARLGPWGAIGGFVARPLISFGASIMGYNIGRNLDGGGLRGAFAGALREIDPGRDFGQIAGYTVGAVLGQALIPIPVLGAIIGGSLMGLIGGSIGSWLTKSGPLARISGAIKRGLGWLADKIQGKREPVAQAVEPAAPAAPAAPREAPVAATGEMSLLGVGARR